MNNITKTTKTLLFASLIAAMILPFSGMMMAEAAPNENANDKAKEKATDKSKSDHGLLTEANKIEKKFKDHFKYDKDGKNTSGKSADHKRHQDIVEELNSRGVFHRSQDQTNIMTPVAMDSDSATLDSQQSIGVFMISPESNGIETNDSACSSCGETHNKKLAIKSGMEWNSPTFPWWEYRVESKWSAFTPTEISATSQIAGDEKNVRPYVVVKSDHAITTTDFRVLSDVKVLTTSGDYTTITDTEYTYTGIYFATKLSTEHGFFPNEADLIKKTKHETTIQIDSIE